MKFFVVIFLSISMSANLNGQVEADSSAYVIMEFTDKYAYLDSSAESSFLLSHSEIRLVDSLLERIVDYYNVQVSRGSLSIVEKLRLDSLYNLEKQYQFTHSRRGRVKKRKFKKFSKTNQYAIRQYAVNQDSIYQIMLSLHARSSPDQRNGVVQFAGMGRNEIMFQEYLRQYMPYLTVNGERMVYVNAFRDYDGYTRNDPVRRADLVNDFVWCGDCYEGLLRIYINLETKKVTRFYTN